MKRAIYELALKQSSYAWTIMNMKVLALLMSIKTIKSPLLEKES